MSMHERYTNRKRRLMKQIGISYYTDYYDREHCIEKIDFAEKLGYKVIFTSLILNDYGFANTVEGISEDALFFLKYAHDKSLEVHADLTKKVLYQIGATVDNLSAISEMKIPVIRLDGGFTVEEIATLTLNNYGIKIEDNLSNFIDLNEKIEAIGKLGNLENYLACHNFYPRNDTGMSLEDAVNAANIAKAHGVRTGVFIGSLSSKADLNNISQSTMTVEDHRYLPSEIQAIELMCTEAFDYILFGDSNPSHYEMEQVSKAFFNYFGETKKIVELPCYFEEIISDHLQTLKSIEFNARADRPEKVLRGCQSRGKINLGKSNILKRMKGTITLDNVESDQYIGEMQITLEDFPPAKYANVVGYVRPYAFCLLEYLRNPSITFKLK